jgi:hypothetical protein
MPARPALLILSISRLVSDPRVLKQIELFQARYAITTCGQGPAPDGVAQHFEIPSDSRGWVDDRLAVATRQYTRAYWNIEAVAAAHAMLPIGTFDGVIANDLNTVPLALALRPRRGVHADLHEFAPREKENDLKWRLFVAPFLRWICRRFLPLVSSATTVAPGIAAQYEADYGVAFGVVTNAAPYAELTPHPVGDPIRLIHSAAGQRYRRLEMFIEAMRDAPANIELDMIVVPHEPDYVAELKALGADVPGLRFRDPVPYQELVNTVAEYDVALAFLPPTNFNLAHALPNKFFEAVQARVGLLIGPSPEMKTLLDHYGFGTCTPDFTLQSLTSAIHNLDKRTIDGWKAAADRAAKELSSEHQNRRWLEAVAGWID